jgi:MFS family permease
MSQLPAHSYAAASAPVPWLAIGAVTATVSVFAIAQGLTYPLLSFILGRQGHSPALIGLSAAMSPLGMIISASLVPLIVRLFGGVKTVVICSLLCATLLSLVALTQNIWLWFPLRFMIGMSVIPLYVLSEVWMQQLAPPHQRGRFMGAYTSIISLGFSSGPAMLAVVGTQGWTPFLMGVGAFLVCGLFVLAAAPRLPKFHEDEQGGTVRRFLPAAPTLLLAVVVASATETSLLALLPTYGQAHGVVEKEMATLLTFFFLGNVMLQVPLGLVAERLSARTVMMICAFLAVLGCLALPLVLGHPVQWLAVFLWGAFSYGVYTMAIVELGTRFSGSMLVAGNAAFALMWGVGGIAGPPGAGFSMQLFGPNGLPLILAAFSLVLLVFGVLRARARAT